MRRVVAFMLFLVTGLTGTLVLSPLAQAADTGQTAPQTGRIVSEEPAKAVLGTPTTPQIVDGTVYSITQVGSQIVVGGTFTAVKNPGSTTSITRNHVFSFDANTGKVSTTFDPAPNGTVYKVLAAADGTSVYIGGVFSSA